MTTLRTDTFTELLLGPPEDQKPWTEEEYAQIVHDLESDPDVTFVAPPTGDVSV